MFSCPKFIKRYHLEDHFDNHVERCESRKQDSSTINKAVRMSLYMLITGEIKLYERNRVHVRLKDMNVSNNVLGDLHF